LFTTLFSPFAFPQYQNPQEEEGEKLNGKFCGMNYDILDKIDIEPNKIA
jgi:hypothetical protein